MDASALPDELRSCLGRVDRFYQPPQGDAAELVLVEAAAGRFAVKRASGVTGATWLWREYEALKALGGTALPVPRAHAFVGREPPTGPEAWLLMDWVPGETVEAALARTRAATVRGAVLRAFGAVLRRLHATPVPPALRAAEVPWLDRVLREAAANLAAGRADAEGTPALLERLRRGRPPATAPVLIHGDFTIDNVLVAGGCVTGIVDWSGAAEGDPRYDLALATRPKPAAFRQPGDLEAFYAGYGAAPLGERERAYFVGLYEFF